MDKKKKLRYQNKKLKKAVKFLLEQSYAQLCDHWRNYDYGPTKTPAADHFFALVKRDVEEILK